MHRKPFKYKIFIKYMTIATETKQIFAELKAIRSELVYIKEHIQDKDIFLTNEERKLLDQSYKNEKEGKLVSSKNLRKQLKI